MLRIEYKYLVSRAKLDHLRQDILPFMRHDKYCQRRNQNFYTVRSIYFDTKRLDFYQQKLAGIRKRQKLRIRCYNEPAAGKPLFLEIKRKKGAAVEKFRARIEHGKIEEVFSNRNLEKYISDEKMMIHANMFFFQIQKLNLQPVIKVIYEREALYYRPYPGLRITIDRNLRAVPAGRLYDIFEEHDAVYSFSGYAIVEIKLYGGLPAWLTGILARHNAKLRAISKYTNSIETMARYDRKLHRVIHYPDMLPVISNLPREEYQ